MGSPTENVEDIHIYFRASNWRRLWNYFTIVTTVPLGIALVLYAVHLFGFFRLSTGLLCLMVFVLYGLKVYGTARLTEEARIDDGILTAKPYLGTEKEMTLTEIDSLFWKPNGFCFVVRYIYVVGCGEERLFISEKDLNDDGIRLLREIKSYARESDPPDLYHRMGGEFYYITARKRKKQNTDSTT